MNVYDFDDTIFRGDSTRAFWAYCLKRAPGLARFLPRQCAAAVRYALGRTAKEAFKEAFFSFLQGVPDADAWAEDFWRTHERRFRPWYLAQKQPDDLVVSASPEFLLAPACRRLGIRPPIASRVTPGARIYTGAISGCGNRAVLFRFPLRRAVGAPGTPRLSGPGRFLHLMGGVRLRSRAAAADI
ncbi:MAG: hypothetical protein EGS37_02680, partial [Ruthenibacterium lactatiformans]|nr:hypothetical protein [Ruthenibacterium lactatiformans]